MSLRYLHITLFILTISAGTVHAQTGQNLIRNWSFEELKPNMNGDTFCPSGPGQMALTKYWTSAYGSPTYFNACSNDAYPDYGLPQNHLGHQQAYDGEAYADVAGYVHYEDWEDKRTFLFQELQDSLVEGTSYRFTFRVSLEDSVNFAMSGMGALLSVEIPGFGKRRIFSMPHRRYSTHGTTCWMIKKAGCLSAIRSLHRVGKNT